MTTSSNGLSCALCVKNTGYAVSLELRKVYRVVNDPTASRHELIRVVDESGEDYLYPAEYFVSVHVPAAARRLFTKRAAPRRRSR
jgi:hypothetical protein